MGLNGINMEWGQGKNMKKNPYLMSDPTEEEKKLFLEHYRSQMDNYSGNFEEVIQGLFTYAILIVIWEGNTKFLKISSILKSSDSNIGEHYIEIQTEEGIRQIILTLQIFDLYTDGVTDMRVGIWYRETAEDGSEYEDDILISDEKLKVWNVIQSTILKQQQILLENKDNPKGMIN